MAEFDLNLSECFEEIPATPGSKSILCLEEFGEASPMVSGYCKRLDEDQYEKQGVTETEKALNELVKHLESDPSVYAKILRKKKKEEQESSGVLSLLKSRFMMRMQGEKYENKLVSETEAKEKLEEMTSGMMMVYNYAKEAHEGRRFSKRLAEKRAKSAYTFKKVSKAPLARGPPPPPPMPPSQMKPLQDCKNIMSSTPATNKTVKILKAHSKKRESTGSVQEELLSFDRVKRLRPTGRERSPGFTPVKTPGRFNASAYSLDWTLNSSEPLTAAFVRVMEQKFKNVRSPSPSGRSLDTSTYTDFSP